MTLGATQGVDCVRRERMFVTWSLVQAMLDLSAGRPAEGLERKYALLFLLSYTFLLRTPSEALPALAGMEALAMISDANSILFVDGESLVIVLRRRKIKPEGSKLAVKCTCSKGAGWCAYHLIGELVRDTPVGERVFEGLSAAGITTCNVGKS